MFEGPHPNYREEVIQALTRFRSSWECAAGETSLIETTASIGYVLADIVFSLDLSSEEISQVLGESLKAEFYRAVRKRQQK